jgi:hypothetical protein
MQCFREISANRVFNIHQADNVVFFEPSQKISGRSRIGDNFGSQRIEVSLIVSPQIDVLQAGAAGNGVVGDVKNVIGLVVRQMAL